MIFVFYSWLSVGTAIVNKESFQKLLDPDPGTVDPDRDPHRRRSLVDCSLDHAQPTPPEKISSESVRDFFEQFSGQTDRQR